MVSLPYLTPTLASPHLGKVSAQPIAMWFNLILMTTKEQLQEGSLLYYQLTALNLNPTVIPSPLLRLGFGCGESHSSRAHHGCQYLIWKVLRRQWFSQASPNTVLRKQPGCPPCTAVCLEADRHASRRSISQMGLL